MCRFTSSIKRRFRELHVVGRAVPAKKCSKTSVLHMKSSCFADQTYCFFNVPVAVAVVVAKADVVGDNKRRSKEGNKALRRKGYH